jgi:HEAT repeat protein
MGDVRPASDSDSFVSRKIFRAMLKVLVPSVVAAGLVGALVVQHRSLGRIESELAALKSTGAAGAPSAPAEAPERRGLFGRSEPAAASANTAAIEQRLAAIEDAVGRLGKASEHLMERGQLPLSEAKAAELKAKFLDASLPDNERLRVLRLLRQNNVVDEAVIAGALGWAQAATGTDPRVAASVLDQLDGLDNASLKGPLLQFASTSTDSRVRRQAIENLERFAGDPAVDALLWKAVQSDEDPAVRRQAENALREGPMSEARIADMRRRALNPNASLEERLTAFRALGNSQTDMGDVATQMAAVAQSAQDPRQRAQIFGAFDGMNNPALAPALVQGLQDASPDVRRQAADALSGLSGDQAVADWLRYVAENDADPRVRREAQQALSESQGRNNRRPQRPPAGQ